MGPAFFGLPFFPFLAEEEECSVDPSASGDLVLAAMAVLSVIAVTVTKICA